MRRVELLIGLSDLAESEHDSVSPGRVDGFEVADLRSRERIKRESARVEFDAKRHLGRTHQLVHHLRSQHTDVDLDDGS